MEEHIKTTEQEMNAELVLVPEEKNMGSVSLFLRSKLKEHCVPEKIQKRLLIAFDEVYTNIVSYSEAEIAEIRCRFEERILVLVLRDNGMPYNPLESEEPDISLPAEKRKIGGLGIFMARKMVDKMEYSYVDGCNVTTLTVRY